MQTDECFLLGYVIKKHGLKGGVNIFLDVDAPLEYSELESVFIDINDQLIPFFIDSITIKGNKAVLQFEDVTSAEQADDLRGKQLFLPLSMLPRLEGTSFYYHEIIGFEALDTDLTHIGLVKDVYSGAGQELLAVTRHEKEVLIPVNDDIIKSVDRDKAQMIVDLPEGLLDIYED